MKWMKKHEDIIKEVPVSPSDEEPSMISESQ